MRCKPFSCIFEAGADFQCFNFCMDSIAYFDIEIFDNRLGFDVEIVEGKCRFLIDFTSPDGNCIDALELF